MTEFKPGYMPDGIVALDFSRWLEEGGMSGVRDDSSGEDRASLKCDGGPHLGLIACNAIEFTDIIRTRRLIERLPYAGTEEPTTINIRVIRDPLSQGI